MTLDRLARWRDCPIEMRTHSSSSMTLAESLHNAMHPMLMYFFDKENLEGIPMEQRQLGHGGPQVSAIGLGCMSIGIADVYTSSVRDDVKAIELIHRALGLGLNFLDTANIYGDSEIKVGKALPRRRHSVVLPTQFALVARSASQTPV